jgi:hypothetical protein
MWDERIELERRAAEQATLYASDLESMAQTQLAHCYRALAAACDHKIEILKVLKEINEEYVTAIQGHLWPPK